MDDCIFCKIVAGKIPSNKVYEDEHTLAFMDIGPIIKGHTLVIPKEHHDPLMDTPPEILQKAIVTAQKVAKAQTIALGADGVNIVQSNGKAAGQEVPHLHFHVIPRFNNDGHRWNWRTAKYENMEEMQKTAEKISGALR